jgi:hypothetical protein
MTQSQDSLSVVLPVHNDAANLTRRVGELLEFLPELTVPFEIVIVDNGSTDRTDETAHELALQYPQLRVCRHPNRQTNEELASQSLNETVSDFVITVAENGAVSTVRLKQLWTCREVESPHSQAQVTDPSVADRLKNWAIKLPQPETPAPEEAELRMMRRHSVDELAIHFRSRKTPAPLWATVLPPEANVGATLNQ